MASAQGNTPPGYLAARIEVLALGAALNLSVPAGVSRYSIFPSDHVLTAEEAAKALAEMMKPLACVADTVDQLVVIKCEEITEPVRLDYQRMVAEEFAQSFGGDIRRLYARGLDNPLVFVRGSTDAVVVDLRTVEEWSHSYAIPGAVSLEPPDAVATERGAVALLILGSAGEIRSNDETPSLPSQGAK